MFKQITQYILIPEMSFVYSTVSIVMGIENDLRCKYAFHTAVPAFGICIRCLRGVDPGLFQTSSTLSTNSL